MSRFALILLLLALSWSQVAIAAPSEHSQDVRPANETTELERREINGLWTTIYARWSTTALDQFRGNVEGELLIINIDVSSPFLKCQTPGQNHDMRCYCDDTMSVLVGDRPKYRYCDATFEIEPLVKGVVAEASPVGPLVPPPRPTTRVHEAEGGGHDAEAGRLSGFLRDRERM
ncbi:MAG: hypothetical protein M1833_007145 [Piccolia ochrophora]|nr:MAG: hypothetical protein M1833_007145 [Piccolia ochrophora]